jgi:hypothetical protein
VTTNIRFASARSIGPDDRVLQRRRGVVTGSEDDLRRRESKDAVISGDLASTSCAAATWSP